MNEREEIRKFITEQIVLLERQEKQCEVNDERLQGYLKDKNFSVGVRAEQLTNMALQQQLMIEVNTLALTRVFKILEIGFMNAEEKRT
jgi:hypothetical protein